MQIKSNLLNLRKGPRVTQLHLLKPPEPGLLLQDRPVHSRQPLRPQNSADENSEVP